MKKSLIALAVAGAMTAPMIAQADATLYGKIEQRLKFVDNDAGDSDAELEADDIRIGVKGNVDMDMESVTGIYGFEFEVNPDDASGTTTGNDDTFGTNINVRKGFVGAKGDFGTVIIGRQTNPVERIVGYTGNLSEDTGVLDRTPDFLGSAAAYVTPSFSGLSGYVALVIEGQGDDQEEDVDGTVLGADYSMGDLNLSIGYWSFDKKYENTVDDMDYIAVGGEYSFGPTKLGLAYHETDNGTTEYEVVSVRVVQTLTDKVWVLANYHAAESETGGTTTDTDQYSLAVNYNLGSKASLDAEYVATDRDTANSDSDTLSFAYTLKF